MILEWVLLVPRTVSWHKGVCVPSLLLMCSYSSFSNHATFST